MPTLGHLGTSDYMVGIHEHFIRPCPDLLDHVTVFLSEAAMAQAIFRTEVYPVHTVTLSTAFDFLLGKKDGKPAMICGRAPHTEARNRPAASGRPRAWFRTARGFNSGMWVDDLRTDRLCHFCN